MTYSGSVGSTCLPTSPMLNGVKPNSTDRATPATESNRLQVDAKHAAKGRGPCWSVVALGSVVDSTATLRCCYCGSSSSFQGNRNPFAVERPLSWPQYELAKLVKTADFLPWMVK